MINRLIIEGFITHKPKYKVSKLGKGYIYMVVSVPPPKIYVGEDDIIPVPPSINVPVIFYCKYAEAFAKDRNPGDCVFIEGKLISYKGNSSTLMMCADRVNLVESVQSRKLRSTRLRDYYTKKEMEELQLILENKEEAELEIEKKEEDICKYL